jgi:hypothetical protein
VLTDAQLAGDAAAVASARREAMLAAWQAVDLLHHLSDFVWKEPATWPQQFAGLDDVRSARCLFSV